MTVTWWYTKDVPRRRRLLEIGRAMKVFRPISCLILSARKLKIVSYESFKLLKQMKFFKNHQ